MYLPIYLPILRVHFEKKKKGLAKDLSTDAYAVFLCVFFCVFFSNLFYKSICCIQNMPL